MSDNPSPIEERHSKVFAFLNQAITRPAAFLAGASTVLGVGLPFEFNALKQAQEAANDHTKTSDVKPMSAERNFLINQGTNHYKLVISAQTSADGQIDYATDIENVDAKGKFLGHGNPKGAAYYPTGIEIRGVDDTGQPYYAGTVLDQITPGQTFGSTAEAGGVSGDDIQPIQPGKYVVSVGLGDLNNLNAKEQHFQLPITVESVKPPTVEAMGLHLGL